MAIPGQERRIDPSEGRGIVDDPHPALAELVSDLVMSERLADHQCAQVRSSPAGRDAASEFVGEVQRN